MRRHVRALPQRAAGGTPFASRFLVKRTNQNDGEGLARSTEFQPSARGPGDAGRSLLFALAVLLLGGHVLRGSALRKDEILCEEAAVHLQECCEEGSVFLPNCDYSDGCDFSTYPALSPVESDCIRNASCADLYDGGVCWLFTGKGPQGPYETQFSEIVANGEAPNEFVGNPENVDRLGVCR